jgi:hypothetical protein
MVMDTNVYTGDKREQKPVVVTVKERKPSEHVINVARPKATHHEDRLVKIGNIRMNNDNKLIL